VHEKDGQNSTELFDEADNSLVPGPSVVKITSVFPNSLAARIGLENGDIIWTYDKWLFFDGSKTLYST
jgi:S1-C subfamily serine protease